MQMEDYVLRSDFEELKEAVKVDKRNLDVSWIILCSESHFSFLVIMHTRCIW
jgi:hypothetical protein